MIVLASSVEAASLRLDEGWQNLSERDALWHFDGMDRWASSSIRDFVGEASLSSFPLSSVQDHELTEIVRRAIRDGSVVALRQGDAAKAPSAAVEWRRLVKEIEQKTRARLAFGGRQYKLVADADLSRLPDRNNYEVVGRDEAQKILKALANEQGMPGQLLTQASEKLTKDWRPPISEADGLVLLRRNFPPRTALSKDEPAITPSQMKAILTKPDAGSEPKPTYTFIWDPPFSQRQWVNLPKAWGVVAFGTEATLTGHVEPKAGGQNVTFALLPDPGNPPEATGAALASTSATSDGEGKVRVKMTFPIYPGAKFKVSGKTATMASPVGTDATTVWRRVFYQVTEMTAAPDGINFSPPSDLIPALEGALNPVWIELAPGTKKSATTPYKSHLTAAERAAVENSLRSSAVDDRSPFKMNIVMIDSADIVAEQERSVQTRGPSVETLPFTKWIHDPTVIRAEYESSPGVWTALANVLVVDLPGGRAKVTAEIPGPPAVPVQVRIKYRYQRGFAGGWGGTAGTIFMCIGRQRRANAASPSGADLQQALTHEIGHALGLVSPSASWLDPDPRDAAYSLRHCGYKTSTNEPRCVMWFMLGGSGDRLQYCKSNKPNDCSHFLMGADLSTLGWI
jgi:hypothetical protein